MNHPIRYSYIIYDPGVNDILVRHRDQPMDLPDLQELLNGNPCQLPRYWHFISHPRATLYGNEEARILGLHINLNFRPNPGMGHIYGTAILEKAYDAEGNQVRMPSRDLDQHAIAKDPK